MPRLLIVELYYSLANDGLPFIPSNLLTHFYRSVAANLRTSKSADSGSQSADFDQSLQTGFASSSTHCKGTAPSKKMTIEIKSMMHRQTNIVKVHLFTLELSSMQRRRPITPSSSTVASNYIISLPICLQLTINNLTQLKKIY